LAPGALHLTHRIVSEDRACIDPIHRWVSLFIAKHPNRVLREARQRGCFSRGKRCDADTPLENALVESRCSSCRSVCPSSELDENTCRPRTNPPSWSCSNRERKGVRATAHQLIRPSSVAAASAAKGRSFEKTVGYLKIPTMRSAMASSSRLSTRIRSKIEPDPMRCGAYLRPCPVISPITLGTFSAGDPSTFNVGRGTTSVNKN